VAQKHRFTYDYKPVDFGKKRQFHRWPWFAAGVGIPLICLAFIAPRDDAGIPSDVNYTDISQPKLSLTIPTPAPDEDIATATESAAVDNDISADTGSEIVAATLAPAGRELTLTVGKGDSLDRMFRRNKLNLSDLANLLELEDARKHLRLIKPGDEIVVRESDGRILQLDKAVSLDNALRILRDDDSFAIEFIERELDRRNSRAEGTIKSSLFLAAADAGISDRTIMNLAGIFAWDIDFVLDIREGDGFTLIYEELWQGGERLAEGEILAAEFVNRGESFRAVRFEDDSGRVDYYAPDGRSVRKAFLRAPLSFSRVSSNFNPRRKHPKLNTIRAHKGVDYAAPRGTAIKAAGDGKILHRGRKGGYGNTVILQHGGNITTLYAHLSQYSKARHGSRVRQGDVIGYVGSSGLATGPHLHYEYRRNGVHLNPRTVKLPEADPIAERYRAEFQKVAETVLQKLDSPRNLYAADYPKTTS
jgi:murein DD-endopeptidase MepM/ murein hydrolase activator NlpD